MKASNYILTAVCCGELVSTDDWVKKFLWVQVWIQMYVNKPEHFNIIKQELSHWVKQEPTLI